MSTAAIAVPTFAQAWEQYRRDRIAEGLSNTYFESVRQMLRLFVDDDETLDTLTRDRVTDTFYQLRQKKHSPASMSTAYSRLARFGEWAVEQGYLATAPTKRVARPKAQSPVQSVRKRRILKGQIEVRHCG